MTEATGETYVVIARIPAAGVQAFQDYESQVLPLLESAGAMLQRRMRNGDGTVEVHIVWFPSVAAFGRYREDPRRLALAQLLARSQARMELMTMTDVAG